MAAIAKNSRVALKTVYLAFETKSGLLRALWNRTLRAGEEGRPVATQPWYRKVLDEPDPERKLRLNARNSRIVKSRVAALGEVIQSAAPTDDGIGALWSRIQTDFHENQRVVVESIGKKALKPGLGIDEAADILWTLNHPNVYRLLVRDRGWTPERYEEWLGDSFCSELLGRRPGRKPASPGQRAVKNRRS